MLQARYGPGEERLWQMATGLGSGMGRRGFVCGAVTGGILAAGLAGGQGRGSSKEDIRALRDDTYSWVQQLTRRFEERFGSVECREMTGCDFQTPEGQARFKSIEGMDRICRPAVRFATETVIDLCG